MNKKHIVDELLKKIEFALDEAIKAEAQTTAMRLQEDMKAEHKYDMRRTEAAYLSDGQKKRIEELKLEKKLIEEIPVKNHREDEEIGIGALLEMECGKETRLYFLSTTSGGNLLTIDGKVILVITVFSPIGSAALGLKLGDSFEVETKAGSKEYLIKKIQ